MHPAALRMLAVLCGAERVALVSDAVAAAGLPSGSYDLFGVAVTIDDGGCCFPDSRTIAGSTRMLIDGVRTTVEQAGLGMADAVTMASATRPAWPGSGSLRAGWLPAPTPTWCWSPPDWQAEATVASGRLRYHHDQGRAPTRPGLTFDCPSHERHRAESPTDRGSSSVGGRE